MRIDSKHKIQINSPHIDGVGSYSQVANHLVQMLTRNGYEYIVASSLMGGNRTQYFDTEYGKLHVYPQRQTNVINTASSSSNSMARNIELPSLMIGIINPRMLDANFYKGTNNIMWAVAETQKMLDADITVMRQASAIWCMSEFVYKITKEAMPENDNIYYVPCPIDDEFKPLNKRVCREFMTKITQRASLVNNPNVLQGTPEWERHHVTLKDLENAFIFGTVGANSLDPSRKDFYALVEIFAGVLKQVPNAYLYLHTASLYGESWWLRAKDLGIDHRILCPKMDMYDEVVFTPREIAMLMNAWDVTVTAEWGAGAGLPYYEAQACGIPFIGLDHSSLTEHTHPHMLIQCKPEYLAVAPKHEGKLWWSKWSIKSQIDAWVKYAKAPQAFKDKMSEWSLEHASKFRIQYVYENYVKSFFDEFEFLYPAYPVHDIEEYLREWWAKANNWA